MSENGRPGADPRKDGPGLYGQNTADEIQNAGRQAVNPGGYGWYAAEEAARRTEQRRELRRPLENKRNLIAALLIAALGISFADSLYRPFGGFGVTLVLLGAEALIFFLFAPLKKERRQAIWLAVPLAVIALSFSLFRDSKGAFLQYLAVFVIYGLQVILLSGTGAPEVFSAENAAWFFKRVIGKPIAHLDFFFAPFAAFSGKKTAGGVKKSLPIILGLLAAVPFAAVLLGLFTSADPLFAENFNNFFEIFLIDLDAARVIFDLFFGFLAAVFCGAALMYNLAARNESAPAVKTPSLNAAAGVSFVAILDLILAVFAVFQIRFLLLGEAYAAALETVSYAEYARRGFFELCFASGLVFALAAAVLSFCGKDGKIPNAVRASVFLMCVCDGIIAASSIKRMLLYTGEYGLSVQRINACFGIAVILTALVWLTVKCAAPGFKALKFAGISVLTLVTLFSLVNVDKAVSAYNAEKYISGELEPDISYFSRLSYTCADSLAALYEDARSNPGGNLAEFEYEILSAIENQKYIFENHRPFFSSTLDDIDVNRALGSLPEWE